MESHSKVCSKCGESKPWSEFSKRRRNKDGLQGQCKACDKQCYQKNRERVLENWNQYYQENRERVLEKSKQYYQKNRERVLEKSKQWRQQNPDRIKQWRQENRESNNQYCKQWHQQNPEKKSAYDAKRRVLKFESTPDVILNCPEERNRTENAYKLRNLLTKATGIEHHVDHIWPLSKGGPHWSGNLQIITAQENLSKSDKFCEKTARVIQESLDEYCSFRYGE